MTCAIKRLINHFYAKNTKLYEIILMACHSRFHDTSKASWQKTKFVNEVEGFVVWCVSLFLITSGSRCGEAVAASSISLSLSLSLKCIDTNIFFHPSWIFTTRIFKQFNIEKMSLKGPSASSTFLLLFFNFFFLSWGAFVCRALIFKIYGRSTRKKCLFLVENFSIQDDL